MSLWVAIPVALVLAFVIWRVGIGTLRSLTSDPTLMDRPEVEDVEALEVFMVCGECGTEFRVTRLGELQIPRHCGEPMHVQRRPAG